MTSNKLTDTAAPDGVVLAELVPWGKQILVEVLESSRQSAGGIFIPRTMDEDDRDSWDLSKPPEVGIVRAFGLDCSGETKTAFRFAYAITFLPNSGVMFVSNGIRYMVFEEGAILGSCPYDKPEDDAELKA